MGEHCWRKSPSQANGAAAASGAPGSLELQQRLATHQCFSGQPAALFSVEAVPSPLRSDPGAAPAHAWHWSVTWPPTWQAGNSPHLANTKDTQPADYTPSHPSLLYNGDVHSFPSKSSPPVDHTSLLGFKAGTYEHLRTHGKKCNAVHTHTCTNQSLRFTNDTCLHYLQCAQIISILFLFSLFS